MKIRDRLPLLAVLCCFSALLLLPEISAQAARDAMLLCAQTLIPSLFPFFVLSSLLIACGASELLSALLSPLMRPLFGLSGAGAAALALGLCGGYPVGARTAAELVENGALSQEEGERLLAFCNNAGPGFLLGVCGAGVFSSSRAGAALYLTHVAAALCAGLLIRRALPLFAKLAEEYKLVFVDLQAGWDRLFEHMHPCNIAWDRIHPNQTGCMYIAKQFLKAIGADRA